MGTFVDADELYYHFSYLSPKNIRRDTLGAMHYSLMEEFQKCLQPFELHAKSSTLPLPRRKEAEYFAKLILDASYIVKTHIQMMSLYRTLSSPQSNLVYVELIKFLDKIERQVNTHVTHPELANIKTNINTELFILHKLFLAEAQMTMNHQFRETIFNIYQSRADLVIWKTRLDREGGKPGQNPHLKIPVYLWLNEFINTMLAKMTLIFYKPLWRQERLTGHVDMRANVSKLELAYPNMIEGFFQKTDCNFFCLVLEAEGLSGYSPDGYVCPDPTDLEPEQLAGMKLYPILYSIPYIDEVPLPSSSFSSFSTSSSFSSSSTTSSSSSSSGTPSSHQSFSATSVMTPSSSATVTSSSASSQAPHPTTASGPFPFSDTRLLGEHLPSIVVLLEDNAEELAQFRPRPVCVWFGNERAQHDPGITYYLFKVTPKVTAVCVYKRRIKEGDSTDTHVCEVASALTAHLRNLRVYSKLIPRE